MGLKSVDSESLKLEKIIASLNAQVDIGRVGGGWRWGEVLTGVYSYYCLWQKAFVQTVRNVAGSAVDGKKKQYMLIFHRESLQGGSSTRRLG